MISSHKCRRHASGFTLIELAMVLVIMAVMCAMAVPRWARSMAHWQADAAARRLCADLCWAQSRARTTSSHQTVSITAAAATYQLVGVPDPDQAANVYTVNLAGSPYFCSIVSAGAADANGNIVFDGFGSPLTSGTIVIQCGDFQRTIQIAANIGTIALQ